MDALLNNFSLAIRLSAVVAVATWVSTLMTVVRRRREGRTLVVGGARVCAVGFAVIAMISTSVRGRRLVFESGGDLVLVPGGAGLGDLEQIAADPTSLAAMLLVGNVALYIPVALAAVIGWYPHRRKVLVGCLFLSLFVESLQFAALGRVAALDDVVLNMIGTAIGYAAAVWVVRRWPLLLEH